MTQLYFYLANLWMNLEKLLNLELKKIESWSQVNKLSLHPQKSTICIYLKKRKLDLFQISLGKQCFYRVDNAKHLGIFIDSDLEWNIYV